MSNDRLYVAGAKITRIQMDLEHVVDMLDRAANSVQDAALMLSELGLLGYDTDEDIRDCVGKKNDLLDDVREIRLWNERLVTSLSQEVRE